MSKPRLEAILIAIGNELLNGATLDTNSRFLSGFFEARGWAVKKVLLIPDEPARILEELRRAAQDADLVVTTGGLGPTSDDYTRAVIAELCQKPLYEDALARQKLERMFAQRNRPMNETNLRQVQFPQGAEILENSEGTADAFVVEVSGGVSPLSTPVLCLPGIPREVHHLVAERVASFLPKRFPSTQPVRRIYLRCFGRTESWLGKTIEQLQLPRDIEVAYRPMFPEILLTLSDLGEQGEGGLRLARERVAKAVGEDIVFSRSPDRGMEFSVVELLLQGGLSIAAAESCTGGLLSDLLVSVPGVSKCFAGSVVSYSNDIKKRQLGVLPELLSQHGAVSSEVAQAMASGIRQRFQVDYALAVTGVAGPDGGSEEKPVGTAWIALATPDGEFAVKKFYPIERNMFRRYCAVAALDLLRRKLLGHSLDPTML